MKVAHKQHEVIVGANAPHLGVSLEVVKLIYIEPRMCVVDDIIEKLLVFFPKSANALSSHAIAAARDHLLYKRDVAISQAVILQINLIVCQHVVEQVDRTLLVCPSAARFHCI